MKKFLVLILAAALANPAYAASLTAGKIVKAAGSSQTADSVITELSSNIGVGSATPGTKLDVQGTIRGLGFSGDGSLLTSVPGIYSPAAWVDCVQTAASNGSICSSSSTTTTGTISSGTNSLSVASASGWSVGMGISVKNAGSGGTTELISYVTAISGTTFTLNDNAAATATGQTVYHDDTRALLAVYTNGIKNVHQRSGIYNVTSNITIPVNSGVIIEGDGPLGIQSASTSQDFGTIINNRGTTNDVITIKSSSVQLKNLTIRQDATITATGGYQIVYGDTGASIGIRNVILQNLLLWKGYGGIKTNTHIAIGRIENVYIATAGGATGWGILHNNPAPYGDITFNKISITPLSNGKGIYVQAADLNLWNQIKVNNCDPCLQIDDNAGASTTAGQLFSNSSFESGSNTGPLVSISSTGSNTVYGITFTGCEFGVSTNQYGVEVNNHAKNIAFIGNDFHLLHDGIKLNTDGGYISVVANTFDNITTNDITYTQDPGTNQIMGNISSGTNGSKIVSSNPNFPPALFERGVTSATNTSVGAMKLRHRTSGTGADGLGVQMGFFMLDDSGTEGELGAIAAVRAGADNTGDIVLKGVSGGTETERVRLTSTGNFGIGTSLPVGLLDVNRKLTVLSGGNVGLGSITPGQALDVQGTVRISNATPMVWTNCKASSGTRYVCVDTSGNVSCSASACSGT